MREPLSLSQMATWLEQAWLQRYLDRVLDDTETAWFESYMLDKPDLLESVEAHLEWRDGMAALNATNANESQIDAAALADQLQGNETAYTQAISQKELVGPIALKRRTWSITQNNWLPVAASMFIGASVGWFASQSRVPDSIAPDRMVFDILRGGETEILRNNGQGDWVLIEIAVPQDATNIQLQLGNTNHSMNLDNSGFASVLLQKRKLRMHQQFVIRYRDSSNVETAQSISINHQ